MPTTAQTKAVLMKDSDLTFADMLQQKVDASEVPVDFHFDEGSGTTIINYGSSGATLNGTLDSGDAGNSWSDPSGLLYAAVDDTVVIIPNNAAIDDITTWERVFVVTLNGAGEASEGWFMGYGTNSLKNIKFNGAFANLDIQIRYSTTDARMRTTGSGYTTSKTVMFVWYDEANDRKIHAKLAVAGSIGSEIVGDVSDIPSEGTLTATTGDELVGNNAIGGAGTRCLDGLTHRYMIFNTILTASERQIIADFFI